MPRVANARSRIRPIPSLPALVALGLAVLVVTLNMPAVVRIPALAILLLVPGSALARLLSGDSTNGAGGAMRTALSILLGILLWLGIALLLNVFGISLQPMHLALGVGVSGLLLAALAGARPRRIEDSSTPHAFSGRVPKRMRSAASVAIAGVFIAVAAWCATAMVGTPTTRYTTLGFVDNKPFAGEIFTAAPGQAVRLNWVLRGVGCIPSPELTSVRLVIDGKPVGDIAVDISSDTSGKLTGAVTFTGPITPGQHEIELVVVPAADDGTPLPSPGYVSTFLEVEK